MSCANWGHWVGNSKRGLPAMTILHWQKGGLPGAQCEPFLILEDWDGRAESKVAMIAARADAAIVHYRPMMSGSTGPNGVYFHIAAEQVFA